MSTLRLTTHFIDQMTKDRFNISHENLIKLAEFIAPLAARFNPADFEQVAVMVSDFNGKVLTAKDNTSKGDCLILAVNIRRGTIPTGFLRFKSQGKPRLAGVLIDLDGNILDR